MAINTLDELIAALPANPLPFQKASAIAEGAGLLHSLWMVPGNPGAAATPPLFTAGAGYVPNRLTTGALPLEAFAAAAQEYYLATLGAAGTTLGGLFLYDRLWHCSGFSGVATTAQAVTTPGALPSGDVDNGGRCRADGKDVEMYLEFYGALGATAATITITYINQAGATKTTTYSHPTNPESVGQVVYVPLAAGDTGVTQVVSVLLSASTAIAGSFGITLAKKIGPMFPLAGGGQPAAAQGPIELGMPNVGIDACLALMVLATSTNTGTIFGNVGIIAG